MLILGIETSCDETGVALFDTRKGLVAHRLHSQIDMHQAYGGVVPELASRDHIRRLTPLIHSVFEGSNYSLQNINAIAVTAGPGLGGALMVGTSTAAGLGLALGKPVIGIHHLEGHLLSPLMATPQPTFPFIALLVSGGHTQLMKVAGVGDYSLLGETVDDAAGEAFDKTASLLGLGYPGGPALSALAASGDPARFKLPRPMLASGDLDFSFSGLKTAVKNLRDRHANSDGGLSERDRANIAAATQAAIVDVLVAKSVQALQASHLTQLVVAGGVGANQRLRNRLNQVAANHRWTVYYPPLEFCTDNGAMIAFAAAMRIDADPHWQRRASLAFSVRPRWPLAEGS
ncbi:MAG: tRNA (adenosine(37)-N6)-threonylcarbamoyltransferase complex transferase subunit TsaD [Betaproteobacteria bacterium]|nr:tRNA (adenosine(37)-N6)-threonylcarbamoyltransferase complex transferase subunit TsaD [Betaproteobacteria bacterium]